MKIMILLKKSFCYPILIVCSLTINAQNGNFNKTNEPEKHDSKSSYIEASSNSDTGVPERRILPFLPIIISDVVATHADIDPATRSPETKANKSSEIIKKTEALKVKLYPNPCQSYAKIAYVLAKDSDISIEIYDALGRKLIDKKEYQLAGEQRAEIDMSHLANGTYICRVSQSNGEVSSRRFVKMQ